MTLPARIKALSHLMFAVVEMRRAFLPIEERKRIVKED